MTVADILERAADRLEKPGGWGQGSSGTYDPTDRPCVGVCIENLGFTLVPEITSALGFHGDDPVGDLIRWNDAEGRTQSEVVAALRLAASQSRAEGSVL